MGSVQITDVTKNYGGVKVLHGASLEIEEASTFSRAPCSICTKAHAGYEGDLVAMYR